MVCARVPKADGARPLTAHHYHDVRSEDQQREQAASARAFVLYNQPPS